MTSFTYDKDPLFELQGQFLHLQQKHGPYSPFRPTSQDAHDPFDQYKPGDDKSLIECVIRLNQITLGVSDSLYTNANSTERRMTKIEERQIEQAADYHARLAQAADTSLVSSYYTSNQISRAHNKAARLATDPLTPLPILGITDDRRSRVLKRPDSFPDTVHSLIVMRSTTIIELLEFYQLRPKLLVPYKKPTPYNEAYQTPSTAPPSHITESMILSPQVVTENKLQCLNLLAGQIGVKLRLISHPHLEKLKEDNPGLWAEIEKS